MKTICIDESGTLGFSSHEPYFVMAALMIDDEKALKRMKNLIRRVNASAMRRRQQPSHKPWYDNRVPFHEKQRAQRQIVTGLSARADHRIAYTVIDKTVRTPIFQRNRRVRHKLRQRVMLRLVAQWVLQYNDDVRIVVSNKTMKAAAARKIEEYIQKLLSDERRFPMARYRHKIEIVPVDPQTHYGLRTIDYIARLIHQTYTRPIQHRFPPQKEALHKLSIAKLRIVNGEFITAHNVGVRPLSDTFHTGLFLW
jgi:hypothetical protein